MLSPFAACFYFGKEMGGKKPKHVQNQAKNQTKSDLITEFRNSVLENSAFEFAGRSFSFPGQLH